jgi:hypothetical protein
VLFVSASKAKWSNSLLNGGRLKQVLFKHFDDIFYDRRGWEFAITPLHIPTLFNGIELEQAIWEQDGWDVVLSAKRGDK